MRFTINDENNFFKDKDKAYIEPPKKNAIFAKNSRLFSAKKRQERSAHR